jgi:hypothetical protein
MNYFAQDVEDCMEQNKNLRKDLEGMNTLAMPGKV